MKRLLSCLAMLSMLSLGATAHAQIGMALYSENFDSLILGPSVNERQGAPQDVYVTALATDAGSNPRPNAFTKTGPAGWTIDNEFDNFGNVDLSNSLGADVFSTDLVPELLYRVGIPGLIVGNTGVSNRGSAEDGVDEWEGWSFADKTFWASVDDQLRSSFTNASGVIAVADGDEYDDLGNGRGDGYINSGLTTASIPVASFAGSTVKFSFDSSWRAESYDDDHAGLGRPDNNQTAIVWASFDGGAPEFVNGSLWDSFAGTGPNTNPVLPASLTYKPDTINERVTYDVPVPAGAQNVKFTFGYINGANDWWWAVDNLALDDGVNAPFWTEDFEAVTLGDSVNERVTFTQPNITAANDDAATTPYPNAFTHTPPAGWNVDNSGIPAAALGDNNVGVFEWEGWSFTTREFSAAASQTSLNSFTKASGNIALADSDEYDDFNGGSGVTRPMTTVLESPTLDITGVPAGQLLLQFDSSWRAESGQTAEITVDFGSGPVTVLSWDSTDGSPIFHATNFDETVVVDLMNPDGATTAKVAFTYSGGNNWFWGLDNIQIGLAIPEPSTVSLAILALTGLVAAGRRRSL